MKIAMSGCFDKFHTGHRAILWRAIDFAGKEGEIIVFLNTDESVRELKGKGRPIDDLETRLSKLNNFIKKSKMKMHVVPFGSEKELLFGYEVTSPDVILHGNDITDITKAVGYSKFPILLVPRMTNKHGKELSTTAILNGEQNE